MRQVILQEFVSLDGMAAGPNDSVDFVPASTRGDRAFGQEQLALMDTIDAMLLGRKTYSMFAAYCRALFREPGPSIAMKLQDARAMDRGAVVLRYVPSRET
jgi:hypothetical protein